eukprot:1559025-Pleurochrysis_carterae.AAC.3
MILFLNKKDLFEAKIAKKNVSDYFSDYDGAMSHPPFSFFALSRKRPCHHCMPFAKFLPA